MRGWRCIGSYAELFRAWMRAEDTAFPNDAVVAFAPTLMPFNLRAGTVRGRDLRESFGDGEYRLREAVPAFCESDGVFVATAIGEECFK